MGDVAVAVATRVGSDADDPSFGQSLQQSRILAPDRCEPMAETDRGESSIASDGVVQLSIKRPVCKCALHSDDLVPRLIAGR